MSFGSSVGGFIAAIELASRIRKEFIGAPIQFKNVSDEVRSLSIVLQDLDIVLSERELNDKQKTDLHEISSNCRNVLNDLEQTLGNYGELSSSPRNVGTKVKKAWKRLKWEPEDIRELRSRITSNVTLLNTFQGNLSSQTFLAAKESVDRLHERQDDRERREEQQIILDWLTPIDYASQQNDFINRRQAGTGEWLLNSAEYQKWLETAKRTLFCPGIPGAGKTILTSIVIDNLMTRFQSNLSIGIAYIYCSFRRQDEQKANDLLASLLKQFVERQPSLPEKVKELYKRHKDRRTRPSLDEILKVLQSVVATFSRVFIIADALDECQVSDGCRRRFLSEIFNLQLNVGANVFATSRFIPEITEKFSGSMSLEIRANEEDVRRYLDGHMSQLPTFVGRNSDLQKEIKTGIAKAVGGMFLLAQLHLDSLTGKRSPKAIRTALTKLATGSDAYDHAYNDAMERIEGQLRDQEELAKQVLSWITCAKSPLTTLQLQHALTVEVGESELDEENLPQLEDMISVCAGLVTVDEEGAIIRLVHYTAQEYFERTQNAWFPNVETNIATVCLTYLSFNVFETGLCQKDGDFEERLRSNPLYDYAAHNWGHHARQALTLYQEVTDFLECEAKVEAMSQALMTVKKHSWHSNYSKKVPTRMTGLHLAAFFGLSDVAKALCNRGYDPGLQDAYGRTPLSWAARNGCEAVMELLLAKDGIDPNLKDKDGRSPLSLAAESGHELVVKLLLARDGVDPNLKDKDGRSPLSLAAESGHELVVKLLLAKDGINPDPKDNYDLTPLWWAILADHNTVVEMLLAADGVDANSRDRSGWTPLSWAAMNGREAVVRVLLAADDVCPDYTDTYGWTPLSRAAEKGYEGIVKLLLATNDVDPNSGDKRKRTPLVHAAAKGHATVVKLLLSTSYVEPDSKDSHGRTPLSWAVRNGCDAVVKMLLAMDCVDPNLADNDGWTPLSLAAERGNEAVVNLLLAKDGVDPNHTGPFGLTPLGWAACSGHDVIAKLLESCTSARIEWTEEIFDLRQA